MTKSDIKGDSFLDTSILKYMAFIKTVETGSFTKASELLNYSQSGISRMINDLEKEWKIILLERNKSGVKLTSDGLRILPYIKRVCGEYEKLKMQIDDINGLQSGLIRIGTFSSVATHWLPEIISKFQKKYPNIDYEFLLGYYSEIESWIEDGRVDCGFTRFPTKKELETVFLEKDELMAVIPENHYLQRFEKVPVEELCNYPFILLERNGKEEISEIFDKAGITPDIKFKTVDDYAVMSMVEKGLGVAILPKLILRRIPYNVCVKSLEPQSYRDICFAVKKSTTTSVAVQKFMDYLKYRNIE